MKACKSFLLIASCCFFMGVAGTSCPGPDLVVTTLETTGAASVNADNSVELPIRVIVTNQGAVPALEFKVSVGWAADDGSSSGVVSFTVPGEASIWYPSTSALLDAGDSVTFEGILTFNSSIHGLDGSITALADSCSGDEFMPDYCRVPEDDETNNGSGSLAVSLP